MKMSPLTLDITGISRYIAHTINRHRRFIRFFCDDAKVVQEISRQLSNVIWTLWGRQDNCALCFGKAILRSEAD